MTDSSHRHRNTQLQQPGTRCTLRTVPGLTGLLLLVAVGCSPTDIDTAYGHRRGSRGGASVNGTGVLSALFEAAGYKVVTKRYLSPSIRKYDVIVWAPDDFKQPGDKAWDFFEDWLQEEPRRTVIYIGRDYDAAGAYWDQVLPTAPPNQMVEILRRSAQARARHARERLAMPPDENGRWFKMRRDVPPRHVGVRQTGRSELQGPWTRDGNLDPAQVDLALAGRLDPRKVSSPDAAEEERQVDVLLASEKDALVYRITRDGWDGSQVLVVTNGSFLLNLPLVQREHRKLAAKLIGECSQPRGRAAFLESGRGGVTVYQKEPGEEHATGFEAFTVWPIGAILLHFVVLGLLYLFGHLALFGRPRELVAESASDFGKHLHALAELLARTQAQGYARERVAHYHAKVRRESGVSHQERHRR